MAQRGWTQMELPEGWTQIIRGRRPPAMKWPLNTLKGRSFSKQATGVGGRDHAHRLSELLREDDPDAEPLEVAR